MSFKGYLKKIKQMPSYIDAMASRIDFMASRTDFMASRIDSMEHTQKINMVQLASKTITRTIIQHLDYHLTTHCNLNCKGCSTFSPIAEKWFAQPDSCGKDMQALHNLIGDNIQQIHLLGGEPLLHPQAGEFAAVTRSVFPHARIDFTTNGLLVRQMPESFWEKLRQTKVAIKFTRYPIALDYEDIIRYVKEKGVDVFSAGTEKPIEYFRRIPLEPAGIYNIFQSYVQCPYTECAQLRDGKLFRCPASAFSDILNQKMAQEDATGNDLKTFALHPCDYIDLNGNATKQDVFSFLSSAIPFCAYCNVSRMDPCVKWEASQKRIEEWVDY